MCVSSGLVSLLSGYSPFSVFVNVLEGTLSLVMVIELVITVVIARIIGK